MQKLTRFLVFLFLALFSPWRMSVIGQVKGKVLDASGKPLLFCQIGLVKAMDSTIVAVTSTDDGGKFNLEPKGEGNYRIMATYVGFKTYYSPIFSISKDNRQYDAGNITLEADTKSLKDVNVIAQKPFMEYKPDRTVYNIENSIIASGNNAIEVLKKLPGVKVDNNDNITVNGQSGVLIMIDGKTSYLSAEDAGSYLRSLDASQIEKIEVITNPSSKYDASGATVINIVRKKNKNGGFNAELTSTYSQGIYAWFNEGVNLNYSKKKWNLFANYEYNVGDNYNLFGGTTNFVSNSQIQGSFIDTNRRYQHYQGSTGRFESDFTPDKKQSIGFVFEINQYNGTYKKVFPTEMYGENSRLDSSLILYGTRSYSKQNTSYSLNYDFKIDSTGKDLSASVDYAAFSNNFNELDVTTYYDSLGRGYRSPALLQFSLPRTINIRAAKVDYEQPIGKGGSFEGGVKASYVTSNNNALYWNIINGAEVVDTAFTNDFIYTEYIYAGYLSYAQKLGRRFYFKFGLRGEETQDKGVQLVHDTTFTPAYFNLFPNGLVTYKLDTNNTLKLSYRRRIWRPDYKDLNPFVYFSSPYSYSKGNPALQPQISNAGYIEEQYKQFGSISFGDEYWTNPIGENVIQNNITHVTASIPANFSWYNNEYAKIESTIPITKWFTSMNTLLFMQQQWQGAVQGVNFTNAGFTWAYNTVNMFTLNKNWSGEVDFNYYSGGVSGPQYNNPAYYLEMGIKRLFAHERGTITLNCSDILFSDHYITTENFQSENFRNFEYYDSRRLRLTISWKLGKSEHDRIQRDKAADDEMNRIKNN